MTCRIGRFLVTTAIPRLFFSKTLEMRPQLFSDLTSNDYFGFHVSKNNCLKTRHARTVNSANLQQVSQSANDYAHVLLFTTHLQAATNIELAIKQWFINDKLNKIKLIVYNSVLKYAHLHRFSTISVSLHRGFCLAFYRFFLCCVLPIFASHSHHLIFSSRFLHRVSVISA